MSGECSKCGEHAMDCECPIRSHITCTYCNGIPHGCECNMHALFSLIEEKYGYAESVQKSTYLNEMMEIWRTAVSPLTGTEPDIE